MAKSSLNFEVSIGGDTSKLSTALKDVDKEIRTTQTELKELDKLAKIDGSSIEIYEKKQKTLKVAIEQTDNKLKSLKNVQSQVDAQWKAGTIPTKNYVAFQTELKQTETRLNELQTELKQTDAQADKLGAGIKNADTKLDQLGTSAKLAATKVKSAQTSMSTFSSIGISSLVSGAAAGVAALTGLVYGMVSLVESTKETRESLAILENNSIQAGQSFDYIKDRATEVNAIVGEFDSTTEGLSNLLATGFSEENLTTIIDSLTGAVLKFPDTVKFEALSESLNETLQTGKGIGQFAQLLEQSGLNLEEFDKAMEGASTEAERQQIILDYLAKTGVKEVGDAYKEANEEALAYEEAQEELSITMAEIAEKIMPLMTEGMGFLSEIIDSLISGTEELAAAFMGTSEAGLTIPELLGQALLDFIDNTIVMLEEQLPMIVEMFVQMINDTAEYIGENSDVIINKIIDLILAMIDFILENYPAFLEAGYNLIINMGMGLVRAIPSVVARIPEIITSLINKVLEFKDRMLEVGKNIVNWIADGIKEAAQIVTDTFWSVFGWIGDTLNSWFGSADELAANVAPPGSQSYAATGQEYRNAFKTNDIEYRNQFNNNKNSVMFNNTFEYNGAGATQTKNSIKAINKQLGLAVRR